MLLLSFQIRVVRELRRDELKHKLAGVAGAGGRRDLIRERGFAHSGRLFSNRRRGKLMLLGKVSGEVLRSRDEVKWKGDDRWRSRESSRCYLVALSKGEGAVSALLSCIFKFTANVAQRCKSSRNWMDQMHPHSARANAVESVPPP